MIVKHEDAKQFVLADGIESRIMGYGGTLMIVENTFVEGAIAGVHDHPHEQDCYVVEGQFEFTIGDETHVFNTGDSFYIPPHVPHGCKALKASKIVDVFSPIREDFLKKAKG